MTNLGQDNSLELCSVNDYICTQVLKLLPMSEKFLIVTISVKKMYKSLQKIALNVRFHLSRLVGLTQVFASILT